METSINSYPIAKTLVSDSSSDAASSANNPSSLLRSTSRLSFSEESDDIQPVHKVPLSSYTFATRNLYSCTTHTRSPFFSTLLEPEIKLSAESSSELPSSFGQSPATSITDSRSHKESRKEMYTESTIQSQKIPHTPGCYNRRKVPTNRVLLCMPISALSVLKRTQEKKRIGTSQFLMPSCNMSNISPCSGPYASQERPKKVHKPAVSIIEESIEETMLTEYWQHKDGVEEKYKKLIDGLQVEEATEIKLAMKKMSESSRGTQSEDVMEVINRIKDDYDVTRSLIIKQKIAEVEELISRCQRKLLR